MSTSAELFQQLGGGDWKGALEILTIELGKSSTGLIAGALGVTPRTVQRMKAAAGLTNAQQKRGGSAHQNQLVAMAAALRWRQSSGFRPGSHVEVRYPGRPEGSRDISGFYQATQGRRDIPARGGWAQDVADLLDAGRLTDAGEILDMAVLEGYQAGLSDVLSIDDYGTDAGFEE